MHHAARSIALTAGLLGGICWVLHLFVDVDALSWAGSGLLVVAAGAIGAGVSRLPWLAAISGLGAAALWWSLIELLRDLATARIVEGVVGALAALAVGLAVLSSGRGSTPAPQAGPPRPSRGNHRG
ncbi:MAG: hypothetical protein WB471_05015 [Nocardioides sp.]